MADWILECDRCGNIYSDKSSIEMVKLKAKDWKNILAKVGRSPRGLYPCPNMKCEGELKIHHL